MDVPAPVDPEATDKPTTATTTTWEDVDLALEHYHRHDIDRLEVLTAERRYFGMLAAYDFMYTTLTRDPKNEYGIGYGWKPSQARKAIMGVESLLAEAKNRIFALEKKASQEECTNPATGQCRFSTTIDANLLESRHAEINDPDKLIWQELYAENLVDDKIVKAYDPVQNMVPDEPIGPARNWRTGFINPPLVPEGGQRSNRKDEEETSMTPAGLYARFIRSDEHSLPTNDLSKMYKVPHQILSGVHCNVSRRLDAYLEAEKGKSSASRYPSNYVRGLTVAYLTSYPFGAGYCGMQAFQRGFALSATAGLSSSSTFFSSSYSHVRKAVQRRLLMPPATEPISGRLRYPARGLMPLTPEREPPSTLRVIRAVSTFQPARIERDAIARFTNPIAEASSRGPIAIWLSSTMSFLLGRAVTPQYAQLLLTNWAARHPTQDDFLRRVALIFGVTFDSNTGLAVPSVGFGSGLTQRKLAAYAARNLKSGIGMAVTGGRASAISSKRPNAPDDASQSVSLEAASASFFKNMSVVQSSSDGANQCGCACHNVAGLRGTEFTPSPTRRLIKERVYSTFLKKSPQLSFTFGMCGYQHPLSANSGPQTQRIKERLLFDQRNVAAAINHSRLVQFLLPETERPESESSPDVEEARERLLGMSLASIARLSKGLKASAATARVTADIGVKFNARMWPLSMPTDSFLRKRIGVYVDLHARRHYSTVLQLQGRFEEASAILDRPVHENDGNGDDSGKAGHGHGCLPEWARNIARECALGQSSISHKAWHDRPAVAMAENRDWPAPFIGVCNDEISYPSSERDYVDRTADMCGDVESTFWVAKTPETFLDACAARSAIPECELHYQYYRRLSANDGDAMRHLERLRLDNEQSIATERPRKVDTTPWSIKNTGQSGRRTTEMTPNSLMVLTTHNPTECGFAPIFLAMVETQALSAKADLQFPSQRESKDCNNGNDSGGGGTDTIVFIAAPDIAPVFRTGGNSISPILIKHFRRNGVVSS
uniref:Wsv192-like protein n=1 Tax=Melicertus latisulcatus pemonivirus TaxID=2984278 RepID=A0A9C7F7X3_9VIRU|nr:MAG: wsv192-like protein [Melicertus latisulcatus pemonivirus]